MMRTVSNVCSALAIVSLVAAARSAEVVGCGYVAAPAHSCYGCISNENDNCACDFGAGHCQSDHRSCVSYKRGMMTCPTLNDPNCRIIYRECVSCWREKVCNNPSGVNNGPCDAQFPACTSSDEYTYAECSSGDCSGDCGYRYFHIDEACWE